MYGRANSNTNDMIITRIYKQYAVICGPGGPHTLSLSIVWGEYWKWGREGEVGGGRLNILLLWSLSCSQISGASMSARNSPFGMFFRKV